jgi:hypothetical protein
MASFSEYPAALLQVPALAAGADPHAVRRGKRRRLAESAALTPTPPLIYALCSLLR